MQAQPSQQSSSSSVHALSGTGLDTYLDDMESTLAQQQEAGVAQDLQQTTLRGLLQHQPLRADTLRAVARLSQLWTQAGEHAHALRVVEVDGAGVRAELPADEQVDADTRLGFWRLHALAADATPAGHAAMQLGLVGMEHQLAAAPRAGQSDDLWEHLAALAGRAGQQDCVRRCARARHALQRAMPERASFGAYDDAVLALRLGDAFAREGLADDARQAGQQAFAALAQAAPGQDVDHDDWLRLGERLLQLLPGQAQALAEQVLARLPADTAPGPRRSVLVQLHRLQARVLQRQGQLEPALALAWQGRYTLDGDQEDGFSAELIDWLLAAGRGAQAAELAYECITNERSGSAGHAARLALQFDRADGPVEPWWPLALAQAAVQEDGRWVCGQEDPAACHARHLARAQALAAATPSADRAPFEAAVAALQGEVLLEQRRDLPAALTLLEFATRHPSQASSKNVENLWRCRLLRYGAQEALRLAFVPCSAAGWNYNLGVALTHQLSEVLPEGAEWPQAEAEHMAQRYYALGLQQFEAFFASGQGHHMDGRAHGYSMLCNNLAIRLYNLAERPEQVMAQVLPLHRKGIAASSFVEHYEGVLRCYRYADDLPHFVAAADALWHYAADYGYSRHTPSNYVGAVARALRDLDRKLEIGLWLQRLDSWWDGLDDEDREEGRLDYLGAKLEILIAQAGAQPEDVRARVQALMPALQDLGDAEITRLAGVALHESGAPADAWQLYRLAQSQLQPGRARDEEARETLRMNMGSCRKQLRPWWRFWG